MEGNSGAGVYGARPQVRLSFGLEDRVTVYQSEVFTIEQCGLKNLWEGYLDRHITIFSDSQAALKALESSTINSKLVTECLQVFQKLGR